MYVMHDGLRRYTACCNISPGPILRVMVFELNIHQTQEILLFEAPCPCRPFTDYLVKIFWFEQPQ